MKSFKMGWLSCCDCKTKVEKVVELDFSRCGISDVPNEVYANSPTLEVLHLEGNKIKDLSPQLFQCIDLKYLNVSDNEIRAIPPLISKLTNLHVLIFNKNILDGVHPSLDKLHKLTVLDLSMNDLRKVPDVVMSLIHLQQLCLNDTGIEFVPANIGRLSNLRILELRDNHLCELPKSMRRLTNLQRLDVSDNNLTSVNEICESHSNLSELWINGNNISELSASIIHLKKLNDFDASFNNLESIPKEIGHWTKITNLILSFNSLTSLPASIGNLRNLQVLKLESNFLIELPATINKLVNLEEINLQNNCLTKLPNGIGQLRKLATLILSENRLTSLPPEIGSCSELTILTVHYNKLEKLPDEIGHLQNLTALGLIGNKLDHLPITVSKLTNLKALWLTPNQSHPLILLQNEKLSTGEVALTSIVFPQLPSSDTLLQSPHLHHQTSTHISFSSEKDGAEGAESSISASLSRTPTPHHKELRRMKQTVKNPHVPANKMSNVLEIKEAIVTNISGEMSTSQDSLTSPKQEKSESSKGTVAKLDQPQQQMPGGPPPYHIAVVHSKIGPNLLKEYKKKQPLNICMPTPKPVRKSEKPVEDNGMELTEFTGVQLNSSKISYKKKEKCPINACTVYKTIRVEMPEFHKAEDFQLARKDDGIYVKKVNAQGALHEKIVVGDKIIGFDGEEFTELNSSKACEDATRQMSTVKVLSVSRKILEQSCVM